jgi:hypothetical protein
MTTTPSTPKRIAALAAAALMLVPTLSRADFPKLPSLSSLTGGGSSDAANDSATQQDQLVKAYVAADTDVLKAQSKMASAVGLKERAAKLNAASEALGAGATKNSLQDSETMQSEASQEIQAKLKDGNLQLDEEGKRKFADALGALGRGVMKYGKLKGPIATFQSSLTGGGMAGALAIVGKLGVGRFIVTSAPSNLRNMSGTLSSAVAYARSHDIPVPEDATAAL